LSTAGIYRRAWSTYRWRFWQLTAIGMVVFGLSGVIETAIQLLAGELSGHDHPTLSTIGVAVAATSGVSAGGLVLFGGLVEHTVAEHQHGAPYRPLAVAIRRLPLVALLIADLVTAVLTAAGVALFVVPGLVAFTFLSLSGALIVSQGAPALGSLAQSARLVRSEFWLTARCVTLPIAIETALVHGVSVLDREHPLAAAFVANAALGAAVGVSVGLVEATLALELIHRSQRRSAVQH
jgi:hypothetical protein